MEDTKHGLTFEEQWKAAKDKASQERGCLNYKEGFGAVSSTALDITNRAAEILAQSIREEYVDKGTHNCTPDGCFNAKLLVDKDQEIERLVESNKSMFDALEMREKEIEELKDEIKNLKYRIDRLINLKNQTE